MARDQFTAEQRQTIIDAIKAAELNTSGEIKVHIENRCKSEVLDRAAELFALLNMHKTELRNGVLFYLAMKDHKFAILGDAGINAKVPDNFWENIKDHMRAIGGVEKFNICSKLRKSCGLSYKKYAAKMEEVKSRTVII